MDTVRIDKWLWAARFFKTRSIASEAVQGGHVKLNGSRPKASRDVREGDEVEITIGQVTWTVRILVVSDKRGPAPEAQRLYAETEESRVAREARVAELRLIRAPGPAPAARPTKRDRRRFERLTGRGGPSEP